MQVWRLNINPGAQEDIDPREFCFKRGILGVGWPIDAADGEVDWSEYHQKAEQKYKMGRQDKGWWPALNALRNRMNVDDLVWTRDKGVYWLARVLSEWRYEHSPENVAADILNVRDCDWGEVGTVDAVPGRVASSFSRGRTLAAVPDDTVAAYSARLYDDEVGGPVYADASTLAGTGADLFSLLSDSACEDLVGMYLQFIEDYGIIPSSCKRSTQHYEFVMKHRKTGGRAVAQVKAGMESLKIDEYSELPVEQVFLFTARGEYVGASHPKIRCLEPADMERFARENQKLMPEEIARWLEIT